MTRAHRIVSLILFGSFLTACDLPGRYRGSFAPDFVEGGPYISYRQMWEFTRNGDVYEIEGSWQRYSFPSDPAPTAGLLRGIATLNDAPGVPGVGVSWLTFSGELMDCEGHAVGTFSFGEHGPDEGGFFDPGILPTQPPSFYDYVPGGTAFVLETDEYTVETDHYTGYSPDFWQPFKNYCDPDS